MATVSCRRVPDEPTSSNREPPPPSQTAPRRDRPTIEIPSGTPPTTLQTRDITVGTGPEARAGMRVRVDYQGVAWSTRRQFDSSFDRPDAFEFTLGSGNVIQGWDRGVAGMRVGGRRELTIPPDLGYGARGSPPNIGPNETLVFVVDLRAVQ